VLSECLFVIWSGFCSSFCGHLLWTDFEFLFLLLSIFSSVSLCFTLVSVSFVTPTSCEVRFSTISAARTDLETHDLIDMTAFNTDGWDVTGRNVWVHDVEVMTTGGVFWRRG
jgi:hypothetical protein